MLTTDKNKIDINEEDLYKIGYEFHSFFNTFNNQLIFEYTKQIEEKKEIIDFPSFCFAQWTRSILNHQK